MKRIISNETWQEIRPHLDQVLLAIIEIDNLCAYPEELLNKYYRLYLSMYGIHLADQLDWWLSENYGISYEDFVTPEEFDIALEVWGRGNEIIKRRH